MALEVTALLDGVVGLAKPLARAVVKEGRSMGEVYRACGATARIADDIPVPRFACYAGHFPTVGVAQVLQEEAAAAVWRVDGSLSFMRLADLFSPRPVDAIEVDSTVAVQSAFLEGHEIPVGLSIKPDGSVITGQRSTPRGVVFLPRTNLRVLDNVARCLKVRRSLPTEYAGHIRAGQGLDVAGVRHIVSTVAHEWVSGSSGEGATQRTQLWLAQLRE